MDKIQVIAALRALAVAVEHDVLTVEQVLSRTADFGCSMAKGSETGGCLNCYAARMHARNLPGLVGITEKALDLPLHWRPIRVHAERCGKTVLGAQAACTCRREDRYRTRPRRIFVNSQSDLFHENLPDEAIDRVFAVMALCPQHIFQVLTKRPERMLAYIATLSEARILHDRITGPAIDLMRGDDLRRIDWMLPSWPLPNVWLGVSVEDQKTADARIPLLLQTPAAKRFVSYEPALGPVSFRWMSAWPENAPHAAMNPSGSTNHLDGLRRLDWIIVGGESGPSARPFDIAWARRAIQECREAGVACFVKQLGANPQEIAYPRDVTEAEAARWMRDGWTRVVDGDGEQWRKYYRLKDRKGGDMSEWPEDLRVREFPC